MTPATPDAADEPPPLPGLLRGHELVLVPVPAVEIADHAHPVRVGCPDRERRALGILGQVRAQLLVQVAVRTFVEKVEIERGEQRGRDHAGWTTSRIPRSGILTQSGRLLSS